jgi:hypothetical protein
MSFIMQAGRMYSGACRFVMHGNLTSTFSSAPINMSSILTAIPEMDAVSSSGFSLVVRFERSDGRQHDEIYFSLS